MKRTVSSLFLAVMLLATAFCAEAQDGTRVPRIGVLAISSPQAAAPAVEAFRAGLHDSGYIEGRNLIIEWRWAQGNTPRLAQFAAELVSLKVDLIVAGGNDGTAAAMRATTTIPVVMWSPADPVVAGFVQSLARPGGNVTGTAYHTPEIAGKILAVLKEAVPNATVVSMVLDRSSPGMRAYEDEANAAARSLGMTLRYINVTAPGDLRDGLGKIGRARGSALYVVTTPAVRQEFGQIIDFAARQRIPAIYTSGEAVQLGGLMSYASSFTEIARRVAWYVHRILKGAKPAELPVEQPTKFELAINLKAARALGLTMPASLLLRADHVIE